MEDRNFKFMNKLEKTASIYSNKYFFILIQIHEDSQKKSYKILKKKFSKQKLLYRIFFKYFFACKLWILSKSLILIFFALQEVLFFPAMKPDDPNKGQQNAEETKEEQK